MAPPRISKLTFGHYASPLGIGQATPTLSWRYEQDDGTTTNWKQAAYEVGVKRDGNEEVVERVKSGENVSVAWPKDLAPLKSRERVAVRVRASGKDGEWTEWYDSEVEAALLSPSDWSAEVAAPDVVPLANAAKRPFHVRKTFRAKAGTARLYATALGVYNVSVNGTMVGDHALAPGWQSYNHRLHYQVYDVSALLQDGENTVEATVGEGWYAGRLTWHEACRNIWGAEPGLMAQLEVDGEVVAKTGEGWEWAYGPILSSEIYDGESYDCALEPSGWRSTKTVALPKSTQLVAPEAPPVRRTGTVSPVELIKTPSGKRILDFGQNLVGWVKISTLPQKRSPGDMVILRFAEVLEKGELGVRPLRSAKATDRVFLSPDHETKDWEPTFTFHGFRYCEVDGPKALLDDFKTNFTAVVIHSDMERIGDFSCSHELVNKLHENVVWSLKGNFVSVPTDCPQRDERLGWTGDLQAFAPTANFLYDTSGFLTNWLDDLHAEQIKDSDGVVPLVIPNTLNFATQMGRLSQAVWGDVAILTPRALYDAYGSVDFLEASFESMTVWLDKGVKRGPSGLWDNPRDGFQLADWLDPRAPPDDAAAAMTDQFLVADAYLVGVTGVAAQVASILGRDAEAKRYKVDHEKLYKAFQAEYVTPSGRMASDTQTAYALANQFNLLSEEQFKGAAERLRRLASKESFRIATGFAGTPAILPALTRAGHLQTAYRMLQEKGCPSWLYPVTMGSTTIWERWDSMMPDGSINPGEMTSFNHYALGAVAEWLHTTVAGLRPLEPGYRKFAIEPRPGGTLTHASAYTVTPNGRAEVSWKLEGGMLKVDATVPPNSSAIIRLGSKEETVGSGRHSREVKYEAEGEWPPSYLAPALGSDEPRQHATLAV